MNKSFLVALLAAASLSACSSDPSDLRPNAKVSVDSVPPGTRETDIYNLDGIPGQSVPVADGIGDLEGKQRRQTDLEGQDEVMLNHDEGSNKIGKENVNQVAPEDKTNDAERVENHE